MADPTLVFASLFICGGVYTQSDVDTFAKRIPGAILVVAGECSVSFKGRVHHIKKPSAAVGVGNDKFRFMRAKFYLWKLPHSRIVYYDLDVLVKNPVDKCALMCPGTAELCAVRDPIATWPAKSKTYFNAGFLVIRPRHSAYKRLMATNINGKKFAEQDALNEVFKGRWHKLPKECNWLHHKENHPWAVRDNNVLAVHGN